MNKFYVSLNGIFATIAYFLVGLLGYGLDNCFSTLIMTVAFFLFVNFIVDKKISFFSFYHFFAFLVLGWGYFARYILIGFGTVQLGVANYGKPLSIAHNHEITALYVLLSTGCIVIGKCVALRNLLISSRNTKALLRDANSKIVLYRILQAIAGLASIFVFMYSMSNIRFATENAFGRYDNIVQIARKFCDFVAYMSLAIYFLKKDKTSIAISLLILLPNVIVSTLFAWKGPIILLLGYILILFSCIKTISNRVIKLFIITFLILMSVIYPAVSLYRHNLALPEQKITIDVENVVEFYESHNLFEYLSNRFANYDYDYHVLNLPKERVDTFISIVGREDERVLSGLVPRAFFPDKRKISIGVEITHYIYDYPTYVYNNCAISYIGAIWLSYGIFGVMVFSCMIGFLLCKLENIKSQRIYSLGAYMIFGQCLLSIIRVDIAAGILSFIMVFIIAKGILLFLNLRKAGVSDD